MPLACKLTLDLPPVRQRTLHHHAPLRVFPMTKPRPSDEQVIEAYERLQSVWAAGAELGIAGQTVHKRLRRCGHGANPVAVICDEDRAAIVAYYAKTPDAEFDLNALAESLGRSHASVALCASRMGLGRLGRQHHARTRAKIGESATQRWKVQPHPKGMLGKTHSGETKAVIGQKSAEKWATDKAFGIGFMAPEAREKRRMDAAVRIANRPYQSHSRAKGGKADDLGDIWFRSSWERNYARYLNHLIKLGIVEWWDYERECFWFGALKRGTVSYRPDFRVKYKNVEKLEYVEIKGWITAKDRTKWKRMKKYHPLVNFVVVAEKDYRQIENRWSGSCPHWEKGTKGKPAFTLAFGKRVHFA